MEQYCSGCTKGNSSASYSIAFPGNNSNSNYLSPLEENSPLNYHFANVEEVGESNSSADVSAMYFGKKGEESNSLYGMSIAGSYNIGSQEEKKKEDEDGIEKIIKEEQKQKEETSKVKSDDDDDFLKKRKPADPFNPRNFADFNKQLERLI